MSQNLQPKPSGEVAQGHRPWDGFAHPGQGSPQLGEEALRRPQVSVGGSPCTAPPSPGPRMSEPLRRHPDMPPPQGQGQPGRCRAGQWAATPRPSSCWLGWDLGVIETTEGEGQPCAGSCLEDRGPERTAAVWIRTPRAAEGCGDTRALPAFPLHLPPSWCHLLTAPCSELQRATLPLPLSCVPV